MSEFNNEKRGLLVLLSSPSGGGKSTVIKKILNTNKKDFIYSISMTTRSIRNSETNGQDYWFVNKKTFQQNINDGLLLEYENVHGNYYGTPLEPIQNWINNGKVVFMDVDVLGALAIKKKFPNDCLMIFLQPPDMKTLEMRLKGRSTESTKEVEKRLLRVPIEMEKAKEFDNIIINNEIDTTVEKVLSIIQNRIS